MKEKGRRREKSTVDKRYNPRHPTQRPVRYEVGLPLKVVRSTKAPRWYEGTLQDISTGGVCLTTPQRLKPSTVIRLEFPPSHLPPMPSTLAEVRWVRPLGRGGTYRIGTAFLLQST